MSKTITQTIEETQVASGIAVIEAALIKREQKIVERILDLVEQYTEFSREEVLPYVKELGMSVPDEE